MKEFIDIVMEHSPVIGVILLVATVIYIAVSQSFSFQRIKNFVETKINVLETKIDAVKEQVVAVDAKVNAVKEQVVVLDAKIDNVEKNLTGQINEVRQELVLIEKKLDAKIDFMEIKLENKMDNIENKIDYKVEVQNDKIKEQDRKMLDINSRFDLYSSIASLIIPKENQNQQ